MYFRAQDHTQQLAIMHTLAPLLDGQQQVGRAPRRAAPRAAPRRAPRRAARGGRSSGACAAVSRPFLPPTTRAVCACVRRQVAAVIIDSVTFHFRQDWPDAGLRARLLAAMAQGAAALAEERGLALAHEPGARAPCASRGPRRGRGRARTPPPPPARALRGRGAVRLASRKASRARPRTQMPPPPPPPRARR